ncbi:MAG: polysaccharide export protein [Vampirovibrionales bacterium]|nr:polysaccharide export protein [Vampirovibrionales bacterium]
MSASMLLQRFLLLPLLGFGMIFSGFALPSSAVAAAPPSTGVEFKGRIAYQQGLYLLGPGDVLAMKTLQEPDFSQEQILVGPDGMAGFPGVGELPVANQTLDAVKTRIETVLGQTLIQPQVSLTLKTTRPGTVYLSGAVMHPGMFQFSTSASENNLIISAQDSLVRTDSRLSNILSNAGGVAMNADLSQVTVTRAATGESQTANLWQVLKEGDAGEDLWVNPGDRIHVPSLATMALNDEDYQLLLRSALGPKSVPIRVIGWVKTPGVYNLDGVSPYLNSALAKAGGFLDAAGKQVIAIRRFTSESDFSTLFVEVEKTDLLLRPNDVIFVAENKAYRTGRFAQEANKALSPFTSIAAVGSAMAQIFGLGGWDRRVNP